MPSLASRPLLAVSLALPTLLILGYLWQKRRSEEFDLNSKSSNDQVYIDSKEVSLKLENLNRSRLDCIEEEILEDKSQESRAVHREQSLEEVEEIKETLVSPKKASVIETIPVATVAVVESAAVKESAENIIFDKPEFATAEQTSESVLEVIEFKSQLKVTMPEMELKEIVPDVSSALHDPLCPLSSSPSADTKPEFSTSPVKSEASDSQKSYESWSDLIEQDEQEELDNSVIEKITNITLSKENARHDSGVASPTEEFTEAARKGLEESSRISSGEDAGIGSEPGDVSDSGQGSEGYSEDNQLLAYHFYVQDYLCGTFIGGNGSHIKKLKSDCNCNVILKDDSQKVSSNQKRSRLRSRDRKYGDGSLNLCIIEGTRANIDKCLDMIRDKFHKHPELTLQQINKPDSTNLSLFNGSVTLSLAEGIMHDVFVASIVNGGHIFVQQPGHPTFSALERLDSCMYNTYTQFTTPELSRPIENNSICVVNSNGGWYRTQVVNYDEVEDVCDIKYIDYGGYETVPADQLRQIRTDFLSLPFQAIECYLANILPTEEDTVSANILEELVAGQGVQARMIGLNEDGIPMVHLYRASNGQTVMVNRELVDRSCANWIEATIIPIVPDTPISNWNILGDSSPSNGYSVMQIKHFENLNNNLTCPSQSLGPHHTTSLNLLKINMPNSHSFLSGDQAVQPYQAELYGPTPQNPGVGECFHLPNVGFNEGLADPSTQLVQQTCNGSNQFYLGNSEIPMHTMATEDLVQAAVVLPHSVHTQDAVRASTPFLDRATGSDFGNMSPGLFLKPYPPFMVGENPETTYIQWSNSDY